MVLLGYLISVAHAGVISDAPKVSEVLTKVLLFLLSVFGVVAVISFVVTGIILLVSQGDSRLREKGKKAFQYSVVGVLIALSSLILVNFVDDMLK